MYISMGFRNTKKQVKYEHFGKKVVAATVSCH